MLQNYVMELLLTLETAVDYTTDDQPGEQQPPTEEDKELAIESTSVSPVPVAPQMGTNTVTHALSALDVNVMAAAATCPTQTKPSASMLRHHVISCYAPCAFIKVPVVHGHHIDILVAPVLPKSMTS